MGNRGRLIRARALVPGEASGVALVSSEPLSFWGGYDSGTGKIVDPRHPLAGHVAAGRILVLPYTRGSSTTTAVLLESLKAGTAPAAIVTAKIDSFLALASIVADEMYRTIIPILTVQSDDYRRIETGQRIEIRTDGTLTLYPP